jgi:hypothetical protein
VNFQLAVATAPTSSDVINIQSLVAKAIGTPVSSLLDFAVTSSQSRRRRLLAGYIWTVSFSVVTKSLDAVTQIEAGLLAPSFAGSLAQTVPGAAVIPGSVTAISKDFLAPAPAPASSGLLGTAALGGIVAGALVAIFIMSGAVYYYCKICRPRYTNYGKDVYLEDVFKKKTVRSGFQEDEFESGTNRLSTEYTKTTSGRLLIKTSAGAAGPVQATEAPWENMWAGNTEGGERTVKTIMYHPDNDL